MENSEIHIHLINISKLRNDIQKINGILSDEEKEKSGKYKFARDRERAIVTYFFRRKILSEYTGLSPENLYFKVGKSGKPYIENQKLSYLKFNYSHSGDLIVYALNRDAEIGVDIELVKEIPDLNSLVKNYFSDNEQKAFLSLNTPRDKIIFFYKIWTRKEAFFKALGTGLNDDLRNINLYSEKFNTFIDKFFYSGKDWIIEELTTPKAYIASICYSSISTKKIIYYNENIV
ncbi:MAG: 4'-phosphopantetheinyl transferase superfamily protein [Ignavibacterium sp.]